MLALIRKAFLLFLAFIAGILILLGSSWLVRKVIYPAPGPGPGLLAQYYPNKERRGLDQRHWVERRTTLKGVDISPQRFNDFSLRLAGFFYVAVPGFYQLGTASDDDSWLFLDGILLVDDHGEHPLRLSMAGVWLPPGPHLLEVEYTQRKGKAALELWWQPFWSFAPSVLPPDLLMPLPRPYEHLDLDELGRAARTRVAQVAAILLIAWLLLATGLWPPGNWRRVLALYLAVAPVTIWSILPQMSLDLWCDELVSLIMFSIKPISVTLSEYPFPNNHIFYNLVNNLFLRLTDNHNLGQVMASPFALRLLSLGFSVAALAWLYRLMLRLFNFEAAWLASLVLATTLPFASFTTQLRGYSLCLLLTVIILDVWLRFLKQPSALRGLAMAMINVALIWALPVNIYLCLSMMLIMVPLFWLPHKRRKALQAGAWLAAGLVAGVLLYLPMWNQVLKHGSSAGLFGQAGAIFSLMLKVWQHLLTGRYLLLPGLAVGVWLLVKKSSPERWPILGAAGLLLLPFLIFWVYGGWPYQRNFLMLAVPWAAGVGLLLSAPLRMFAWGARLRWSWLGLIFLICFGSYLWSLSSWRSQVERANSSGRIVQNLSYAYYLHRFNPRETILKALRQNECKEKDRFIFSVDLHDGGAFFEHAYNIGVNLRSDKQDASWLMSRCGSIYIVGRKKIKASQVPISNKAVLIPLNSINQFYHLYRWGP